MNEALWRGVPTGLTILECWAISQWLWAVRPQWVLASGKGHGWITDCLTVVSPGGTVVPVSDLDVAPSVKVQGRIHHQDRVMGVFEDETTGLRLAQWAALITPGSGIGCAHNAATVAAFLRASPEFRQRETVGRLTWLERRL